MSSESEKTVRAQEAFRERAKQVLDEAWSVGGDHGVSDPIETQLRILNGLLAMALTEVCAPPYDNDVVRLRDGFKPQREDF